MKESPNKFIGGISQAFGAMFSDVGQAINPFDNKKTTFNEPKNDSMVYGSQEYFDKKFFEKHGMTREEKRQKENEKTLREQTIENNKKIAEQQAKEEKDKVRKDAGLLSQQEALTKLNDMLNPGSAPFTIKRNIRRASSRRRRR